MGHFTKEGMHMIQRLFMMTALIVLAMAIGVAVAEEKGGILFKKHCKSCHGANGSGTVKGPALTGDFKKQWDTRRSELMKVVRDGCKSGWKPQAAPEGSDFAAITRSEYAALVGHLVWLE